MVKVSFKKFTGSVVLASMALWCAGGLQASPLPDRQPDNPRWWLHTMSHAFKELNYQGVFNYQHGEQLETLQIFHQVDGGIERERIVHLTGTPREMIRNGHEVSCVHPGNQRVRLDQTIPAGPFSHAFPDNIEPLESYYQFGVIGPDRVAGRSAIAINVRPKDPYRFGYQLALDQQTGLLLKSLLLDAKHNILERFQYSTIDIHATIDPNDLKVVNAASLDVQHHTLGDVSQTPLTQHHWLHPSWLPPGFVLSGRDVRHKAELGTGPDSMMYSDGLANFTIFIEAVGEDDAGEGVAHRGATAAVSKRVQGPMKSYLVTVVGEIPVITASKIINGMKVMK